MQWYKKVAANTFFQIIARIFSSGSSFIITILLARSLGIAGYGDFAKITAYVSLFYFLSDFGLNAIFLQKEHPKGFAQLLQLRVLLSLIFIIVVNIVAFFLPYFPTTGIGFSPLVKMGIILFSFTILTEALSNTATALFQKKISYEYYMLGSIVGSLVTLVFVCFAVLLHQSLLVILVGFVIGAFVRSAVSLVCTGEKSFIVRLDISFAKELLQESLPIALMLFCNLLYFRVDMMLLSFLKPSSSVALYDYSYKFFDFLIALPLFLSNTLYPSLLQEKENRSKIMHHLLLFFIISLPITVVCWLLAPLIGIIKQDFLPSVLSLRILLLFLPAFFVSSIAQWILIARKQQKFLLWVYALSLVLNIVGNLAFIPQYSYIASASLTGIGEVLIAIALAIKIVWRK